jgi:hypothetical protein
MAYTTIEKHEHPADPSAGAHGIVFHLPSQRRFIPYAWLVYAAINHEETEILFQFTHSTVIVTGTDLATLHDWASRAMLKEVRESPPSLLTSKYPIVRRIEITEKTDD